MPYIPDRDELADDYRRLDLCWGTARIEVGPVQPIEAVSSGVCCLTTSVRIAH